MPFTLSVKTTATRLLQASLISGVLVGASFGQDTTAPAAEAPATEAPAAEAPADPTLPMGEPVNVGPALKTQEEAAVGEIYLAATHGDWEQRCLKSEDGSDPCRMFQTLRTADGNPTAEITLSPLAPGGQAAAGATILVPLDTLLSANLLLQVDGNQPLAYPYTVCSTDGCLARIGLSGDQVTQMKNGAQGIMTIVPAQVPDQQVPLVISLKGFTAAYDAVAATIK